MKPIPFKEQLPTINHLDKQLPKGLLFLIFCEEIFSHDIKMNRNKN